jgi:hypothetical protein
MMPVNCTPYNEYAIGYSLLDSAFSNSTIIRQREVFEGTERVGWFLVTPSGLQAFVPARSSRVVHPRTAPFVIVDETLSDPDKLLEASRTLNSTYPEWLLPSSESGVSSRDCPV